MSKLMLPFLLLAGLMLVGCGAQPGKSVVKYTKGDPTRMTEAPFTGMYSLYSSNAANPDVSYSLTKGDPLGFVEEAGKIYAVAGTHRDEVRPGMMSGTYYWKAKEKD